MSVHPADYCEWVAGWEGDISVEVPLNVLDVRNKNPKDAAYLVVWHC